MSEQVDASHTVNNAALIEGFLAALQAGDFDAMETALDDGVVYDNVGFPTFHGRTRIMSLFRKTKGRVGFEVKIHRIAVNGQSVLTERTDAVMVGRLRLQVWVCGIYEVHDGRITLWRDYFDLFDTVKAIVRGVLGLVVCR